MSQAKPVTETAIVYLKEGTDLAPVHAGNETNPLVKLARSVAAREGFIRQYWGQQHENPDILIWSIDWQSLDHHKAFINHEDYKGFISSAAEIFDFERAAPLLLHTTFTSDANAAREAPVTENAFFMMPNNADDATKTKLEDDLMPVINAAAAFGKSPAIALGWVFEDLPHAESSTGQAVALQVLVGWDSLKAHQAFTQTPEFAQAVEPLRSQVLPPLQDGKGMFHVNYSKI